MTELERLLLENERMYKTIQALHEGIKMQKQEWDQKEQVLLARLKHLEQLARMAIEEGTGAMMERTRKLLKNKLELALMALHDAREPIVTCFMNPDCGKEPFLREKLSNSLKHIDESIEMIEQIQVKEGLDV